MSSTTLRHRPANQDVRPVRASRALIYATFLAVSIVAMVAVRRWYNDDAFIAFRMARNFADTGHWQYNVGVAGGDAATSPLWVLLCAGALKLHSNISVFATVTTVIFSSASAGFLYESLRGRGNARAGYCVGVLVAGAEILAVNRGMEIPLTLALASASLWAVDQHRYVAAGVLLGLVIVARADMILFAGLILLWVAIADRRTLWRVLGGFAAVIAGWSAFALVVIGSIIPDTLTAKVDQGKSGYWGGHPYMHGITNVFALRPFGNGGLLDIAWFGVAVVLALIGLYSGLHDPQLRSLAILFSALGVLYVFAYGIVLNVPDYSWYYGVPAFCGLILAGIGLAAVLPSGRHADMTAGVLVIAFVMVSLVQQPTIQVRYASYASALRWMDRHVASNQSLASLEIGYVGWVSPNREIVDYLGLLSNQAASKVAVRDMLWWPGAYQPDYWLVARPALKEDNKVLRAPWFPSVFHEVWSDRYAVLYRRTASAPKHP